VVSVSRELKRKLRDVARKIELHDKGLNGEDDEDK
jgi:hypothetical protein